MTYQVLAHKWRPQNFTQLIGQEQVVISLMHSLQRNQLHHAYLFTGTRGVGKTSVARILAKALNCELGITDTPCGQCAICQEITQGTFVDLLEIDAASKTKVEDTRLILENVQYVPTKGRFKIYLIDEVHMLSNHSFNALLKTLEEPPAYVKFLLATTNPDKLPKTILSRCFKFHLQHVAANKIAGYLAGVLKAEKIDYEQSALDSLAQAGAGSVRDSLTLLDQVIAYSSNQIKLTEVESILGIASSSYMTSLLQAIFTKDTKLLLKAYKQLVGFSVEYQQLLTKLLCLVQQLIINQVEESSHSEVTHELLSADLVELSQKVKMPALHSCYQTLLMGQAELAIVPEQSTGFLMILLRALNAVQEEIKLSKLIEEPGPSNVNKSIDYDKDSVGTQQEIDSSSIKEDLVTASSAAAIASSKAVKAVKIENSSDSWDEIITKLNINGMTLLLARNCILEKIDKDKFFFKIEHAHRMLLNKEQHSYLETALCDFYQRKVNVDIEVSEQPIGDSPLKKAQLKKAANKKQVLDNLKQDSSLMQLEKELAVTYTEKDVTLLE